jgi:hypothetical protein
MGIACCIFVSQLNSTGAVPFYINHGRQGGWQQSTYRGPLRQIFKSSHFVASSVKIYLTVVLTCDS